MPGMAVVLAVAGMTGVAAADVTDGTYTQGNVRTGAGVRMVVKAGRSAVRVVRLREHCRYGDRAFTEWIKFVRGTYDIASTTRPNQCKGSKTYRATPAGR